MLMCSTTIQVKLVPLYLFFYMKDEALFMIHDIISKCIVEAKIYLLPPRLLLRPPALLGFFPPRFPTAGFLPPAADFLPPPTGFLPDEVVLFLDDGGGVLDLDLFDPRL